MKEGGREEGGRLYPEAPLALQGTTWLKLEIAKEGSHTNGGENRPRWHMGRLQEDEETSTSKSQVSSLGMWLSLCEGSLRHPSPGPSPACSLMVPGQASCPVAAPSRPKSLELQWGRGGGGATRAMPTLAGPHCPRPPPQAFLFTKNVHCRHLPGAWVTMGWVCFLDPSGGRNFLTRKRMSKKRPLILVCVHAMCTYAMYVYICSGVLCACSALSGTLADTTLFSHGPHKAQFRQPPFGLAGMLAPADSTA